MTLARSSIAQENEQQRVLALYVTTPGAAGAASFEAVYQRTLGSRLDFHSEFIDLARFSMPEYPAALADYLRHKYTLLPPDVVIATTEGSRQYVERFREELFPGIPIVFVDRATSSRPGPGMTGVSAPLDLAGTLDLVLTHVRELENVIERAMIRSTGDTLVLHEGLAGGAPQPPPTDLMTLDGVERHHIECVLQKCNWRINGAGNAAEQLGLHPNTLRFRMKKLVISRPTRAS